MTVLERNSGTLTLGCRTTWALASARSEGKDGRGLIAGRVYAGRTRSLTGESKPACFAPSGVGGGVEGKLFSGETRVDPVALLNDLAPSSVNSALCASGDRGVDCGGGNKFCPTSNDVLSRGREAERWRLAATELSGVMTDAPGVKLAKGSSSKRSDGGELCGEVKDVRTGVAWRLVSSSGLIGIAGGIAKYGAAVLEANVSAAAECDL